MRLGQGWSGEIHPNQWGKINIEVDEVDLSRMLTEAGLADIEPSDIPTGTVFRLLDLESERLLLAKVAAKYGQDKDTAADRLRELATRKTELLTTLADKFATPTDEHPGL